MAMHDPNRAMLVLEDEGWLRRLYGVRRIDGGPAFGPPDLEGARALASDNPELVVVSYLSTEWSEHEDGVA